ncbi:MAG: hypothetical protein V4559_08375 [Pseudomonadota bacterium]
MTKQELIDHVSAMVGRTVPEEVLRRKIKAAVEAKCDYCSDALIDLLMNNAEPTGESFATLAGLPNDLLKSLLTDDMKVQ